MRFTPLLLAVLLFACTRPRSSAFGPYRNLDKWFLSEGKIRQPLRGRPKQITEWILRPYDTVNPEYERQQRHLFYVRYAYDSEGDMIGKRTYMSDSLSGSTDYRYDEQGIYFTILFGKDSSTLVSTRLPDGRFKVIDRSFKGDVNVAIQSFTPDGGEVTEERYSDTSAGGKPKSTVRTWYEDGMLVRMQSSSAEGYQEWHWIYSRWNSPDSILAYTGQPNDLKLASKALYYNNDFGDPVREIVIYGTDTMSDKVNRYVYDSHRNWTRKIEIPLKDKTNGFRSGEVAIWEHQIDY